MWTWLRAHKSACRAILYTSLAWTAVVHAVIFFVLQSDLPVCLVHGSCWASSSGSFGSPMRIVDSRSETSAGRRHWEKYSDFFGAIDRRRELRKRRSSNHSLAYYEYAEADDWLEAFQAEIPDFPLENLTFWEWSEHPGGAVPEFGQYKHWIPAGGGSRIGDRGERIRLRDALRRNESVARFSEHHFDVVISDLISVNRSIPDPRSFPCKARKYSAVFPNVSVVICFHNEAWSALMRTVWSVINRTPHELLKEIILVDDASEFKYSYNRKTGQTLDGFVKSVASPKILLLRSGERLGLVKARLLGASHSTGQVLVFLDSHCECNRGWLPPLLERILANRRTVACPVIDVVSHVDFSYVYTKPGNRGGFDWMLDFYWFDRGDRGRDMRTPVMAGGIFAVDKKYFYEVGAYDEGLSIWGMENVEMSIRVWTCGGRVEIVPCSRVGHIFRSKNPASFPGGIRKTILGNKARVAEVWMDDYKHFFFGARLAIDDVMDSVEGRESEEEDGLRERKRLRRDMNCRSFRWFLDTLFPDSRFPVDYVFLGQYVLSGTNKCITTLDQKTGILGLSRCLDPHPGPKQLFAWTKSGRIVQNGVNLFASLDLAWMRVDKDPLRWKAVDSHNGTRQLKILASPHCLTWNLKLHKLALAHCNLKLGNAWILRPYPQTE